MKGRGLGLDGAAGVLGAIVRLKGGSVRWPIELRVKEAKQPHLVRVGSRGWGWDEGEGWGYG